MEDKLKKWLDSLSIDEMRELYRMYMSNKVRKIIESKLK